MVRRNAERRAGGRSNCSARWRGRPKSGTNVVYVRRPTRSAHARSRDSAAARERDLRAHRRRATRTTPSPSRSTRSRRAAIDVPTLYRDVLAPLLVDEGERWQRGDEHVWEEHYSTAVLRTIVEALAPTVGRLAAACRRRRRVRAARLPAAGAARPRVAHARPTPLRARGLDRALPRRRRPGRGDRRRCPGARAGSPRALGGHALQPARAARRRRPDPPSLPPGLVVRVTGSGVPAHARGMDGRRGPRPRTCCRRRRRMLPLRIAARFIRTSAGQSLLIACGIGVGIAVQIFVGTLITSLQANLLETTIGTASHVTLLNATTRSRSSYSPALKSILRDDPRVKLVVPVRTLSAIFTQGQRLGARQRRRRRTRSAGLDLQAEEEHRRREPCRAAATRSCSASRSRRSTGCRVGDPVLLTLPNGVQQKLRLVGRLRRRRLDGQRPHRRSRQTSSRAGRSACPRTSTARSRYSCSTRSSRSRSSRTGTTSQAFKDVQLKDWQVQNKELLVGLQSQSSSSYMIQAFVLVAVALGIASTLAISAVQKTRQIGILKAMGLSDAAGGARLPVGGGDARRSGDGARPRARRSGCC